MSCTRDLATDIYEKFHTYHPRLKFTIEEEASGTMNFLELTIINNKQRFDFKWYHKPFFLRKIFEFYIKLTKL